MTTPASRTPASQPPARRTPVAGAEPPVEPATAVAPGDLGDDALTTLRAPGPRADLLPVDQPLRPPLAPKTPRTNPWVRIAAYVGTLIIAAVVALMIFMVLGADGARRYSGVVVSCTLIAGSLIGYLLAERVVGGRTPLVELAPRRAGGLLAGAALGVVLLLLCTAGVALLGGYRIDGVMTPTLAMLGTTILGAGLQAAIFEELTFRGILFRYVEAGLGSWGALAVSALFFGLAHMGNPNATLVGALCIAVEAGILFGVLYLITRSLWVLMGLHAAWNLAESFMGIQVSGTTGASFLRTHQGGSELISGGAFGIEASLVTVVILSALSVYLLLYAHRHGLLVPPPWVRRHRLQDTIEPTSA